MREEKILLRRSLVETWARGQSDLSPGWYVTVSNTPYRFKVKWQHPESKSIFELCTVNVRDDTTIQVESNTAHLIREWLQRNPEGFMREARFFEIFQDPQPHTPRWLCDVMRASIPLDRRGIDGFAQIQVGTEKIKLPLQVKSSRSGKRRFLEEKPKYRDIVTVILIKDTFTDEHIRQQLYTSLGRIRKRITRGEYTVTELKAKITEALGNRPAKMKPPALITE